MPVESHKAMDGVAIVIHVADGVPRILGPTKTCIGCSVFQIRTLIGPNRWCVFMSGSPASLHCSLPLQHANLPVHTTPILPQDFIVVLQVISVHVMYGNSCLKGQTTV